MTRRRHGRLCFHPIRLLRGAHAVGYCAVGGHAVGTTKVKMILVTLRSPPLKSASPWLIKFRIVPTINATYKERRGTPSDTHHEKTCDSCIKLSNALASCGRGPEKSASRRVRRLA